MNIHRIEKFVGNPIARSIFRHIAKQDGRGYSLLDGVISTSLGEMKTFSPLERFECFFLRFFVDSAAKFVFKTSPKSLREKVFSDPVYRKLLPAAARSAGEFGLSRPQVFSAPLLVVWNFTNACNLRCKHCYQEAGKASDDELTLQQKLNVVDQLDLNDVPFLAFSGGEPLMGKDFFTVAKYAAEKGMYVSIATNGTLLTKGVLEKLADSGVKYVEISLDSANPDVHDEFRGAKGVFKKTIKGIKNAVSFDGIEVGIASTITKLNFDELEDMIKLAIDLKVDRFYAFNFIPTGRGEDISDLDLTPEMREEVLKKLHKHLIYGDLLTLSTAPQFARACLMYNGSGANVVPTSHYTTYRGREAFLVAQYLGGCACGRLYCAIQPNGIVTPCVYLPIEVGDLKTQSLAEIWHSSPLLSSLGNRENLKGHCGICEYRDVCGGCRARAYSYFGDYNAPDPGCINNIDSWKYVNRNYTLPPNLYKKWEERMNERKEIS